MLFPKYLFTLGLSWILLSHFFQIVRLSLSLLKWPPKKKKIPFIKIVCLLVEHVYILCKILGTAFLWCQFLVYLRRWFFFWLNYTKSKVCVIIYFQYFENSDRFKKVSKLYHFLFIWMKVIININCLLESILKVLYFRISMTVVSFGKSHLQESSKVLIVPTNYVTVWKCN